MREQADHEHHERRGQLGAGRAQLRRGVPADRHGEVIGLRGEEHEREQHLHRYHDDRGVPHELAEPGAIERNCGVEDLADSPRP